MILDFKCKETKKLYLHGETKKFNSIAKIAIRKLKILNAAVDLNDLRVPPGNGLEPLLGDRCGQHSIKINDQYRICFKWRGHDAKNVEITDYH
jgi:proteic killer suppression protein